MENKQKEELKQKSGWGKRTGGNRKSRKVEEEEGVKKGP